MVNSHIKLLFFVSFGTSFSHIDCVPKSPQKLVLQISHFETIFNVEVVDIHNEPVPKKLHKNLLTNRLTERVLNLFYTKKHIFVNDTFAHKVEKIIRKLITKVGLVKRVKEGKYPFGESVILILRKK